MLCLLVPRHISFEPNIYSNTVFNDNLKLSKVALFGGDRSGAKIIFSLKQGEKTQNSRILDRQCNILEAWTFVQQITLRVGLSLAKLLKLRSVY